MVAWSIFFDTLAELALAPSSPSGHRNSRIVNNAGRSDWIPPVGEISGSGCAEDRWKTANVAAERRDRERERRISRGRMTARRAADR